MLKRLERALCAPVGAHDVTELEDEDDSQSIPGPVLHEEDSPLAKLQGRLPPVEVDGATRARILERFETAQRQATDGVPPGNREPL
jgi:hypothetical protein